jgi:GMP reductase
MRIEDEIKLDFRDVLIRPKRSTLASRKEVNLNRTYKFKHSGREWTGIPIMAANMDGVGTFDMTSALYKHSMFTCLVKSYSLEDFVNRQEISYGNYCAISSGTSDKDWSKLQQILNTFPEFHFICIDVANGYSEHFGDFVAKVRASYPKHTIIAGSVCTTRIQTGVGYPQLSAIIECADAAHGLGGHIVADGGCACPGDVAKAFGAGADFVMLGGMLAGHDEGGGEVITNYFKTNEVLTSEVDKNGVLQIHNYKIDWKKFVEFYGMSSDTAMEKHHGGIASYRSSEGRTVKIPYRGSVNDTVLDLLGGLRSACTYVGAPSLKQLSKCTTFVRVNRQVNDIFLK